jgi:hypothetical protein
LLFGIYGLYIYSVIGAAGPYFFLLIWVKETLRSESKRELMACWYSQATCLLYCCFIDPEDWLVNSLGAVGSRFWSLLHFAALDPVGPLVLSNAVACGCTTPPLTLSIVHASASYS